MTSETLTPRVFEPAREHIQSALESGEITTSDDLADTLADVLHTATQKHLAKYRKPLYARDIVGRMYSTASACEYLNLTQEELDRLVEDRLILKVTDSKGRNGYPLFQFRDGAMDPDVQKIIQTLLDGNFSQWRTAIWLTIPSPEYGGKSALEYMKESPENYAIVLSGARNDVNDLYANS